MPNLTALLDHHGQKTLNYFKSKLVAGEEFKLETIDLAAYYKLPMMFIYAGDPISANLIINQIFKYFSQLGDFKTSASIKSCKPEYSEYYTYMNGWILRAAVILQRNDIPEDSFELLENFKLSRSNGYLSNLSPTVTCDVLTSAHLGLLNIERRNMERAISCGDFLCSILEKQSNIQSCFYLRSNEQDQLITEFSEENKLFYCIDKKVPEQLYFMIAYPAAFLGILYHHTQNRKYLNASKAYLDFGLTCHSHVLASQYSHKLAWAASIVYEITHERKYLDAIEKITRYFMSIQNSEGLWFPENIETSYDQSAELACWFFDISENLKKAEKKISMYTQENKNISSFINPAIKYGLFAMAAGYGIYHGYTYLTEEYCNNWFSK